MADTSRRLAHHEPTAAEVRNARRGLALFCVYLLAYAGFMLTSAFRPDWMSAPAWAGVNVAILYGLGLIVGAGVLAVVYMLVCRDPEPGGSAARDAAADRAGEARR